MAATGPAGLAPLYVSVQLLLLLVYQHGMTTAFRTLCSVRRTSASLQHQGYKEAHSIETAP